MLTRCVSSSSHPNCARKCLTSSTSTHACACSCSRDEDWGNEEDERCVVVNQRDLTGELDDELGGATTAVWIDAAMN